MAFATVDEFVRSVGHGRSAVSLRKGFDEMMTGDVWMNVKNRLRFRVYLPDSVRCLPDRCVFIEDIFESYPLLSETRDIVRPLSVWGRFSFWLHRRCEYLWLAPGDIVVRVSRGNMTDLEKAKMQIESEYCQLREDAQCPA